MGNQQAYSIKRDRESTLGMLVFRRRSNADSARDKVAASDRAAISTSNRVAHPRRVVQIYQNRFNNSHHSLSPTVSNRQRSRGRACQRWAKRLTSLQMEDLVNEYQENRGYVPTIAQKCSHAKQSTHNRYRDIECIESTRVILKYRKQEENYIHANWVKVNKQRYICTQGPINHTVDDFWSMILQEKVGAIVMLCGIVEDGMKKCAEYWPQEVGGKKKYGEIEVENSSISYNSLPKVQITVLLTSYKKQTHTITHFQWLGWPDDGIPDDLNLPFKLLRMAKDSCRPQNFGESNMPILVHCSAGVGRTGTLVAMDMARERLKSSKEDGLKMPQIMRELRDQRAHSIQCTLQYLYLNASLLQNCIEEHHVEEDEAIRNWLSKYRKFAKDYADYDIRR
uniref:Uncharacterized protein n=1 Tax=Acrobeloides nanus TaxID=290746 RepID=A0A914DWB7_9BILA